ncbi:MAG TPA: peptidylprolyl isomerase [Puia sp.]|nr:peptidylprolyl isomerase [Puia sp.]
MKPIIGLIIVVLSSFSGISQKMTVAQMKAEIEKSANSPLYVKDVLKKRFKIDTIVVTRTRQFQSLADSLAYKGQLKKVYGPYEQANGRFLVQVLAKAPNTFYRISQIFLDTSVFRRKFADSLANKIIEKIKSGAETFEHLARSYSMGGEGATQGDLGWVAQGVLMPTIENELLKRKKGEVFKVWSRNGVHIIKKTDEPKKDTGFALMMRIFL